MFDHNKLEIWRRSMALSVAVDRALLRCTVTPAPGLASQLSRACASIPANIAECAGQSSSKQSARFIDIAIGSASETENHLARAGGLEVISLWKLNAPSPPNSAKCAR
jgi:four helix bundle protein